MPAANLVGKEGDGSEFTYEWFRYERLMIAARCCGAADRLLTEAEAFSKERVQFGEPIGSFQAIQHMLADSLTELWAARLMTYRTAQAIDEGADLKVQHAYCSMVKLYASEMADASPTGRCRSSAAVATCARTSPSASTASFASTASGREPPRSSATSSPTSWPNVASTLWPDSEQR